MRLESKELAKNIRESVLKMTSYGGSSHIASCLSIADIMAVLYSDVLRVDKNDPLFANRDYFILSKGHAGAAAYAALAHVGFFDTSWLDNHYQNGSIMSGHVSHKGIPGVELSTGSLGQGLGVATGLAYGLAAEEKDNGVFVVMSDGECDEGSVWEAALFAGHHELTNLCAIIDYNKLQSIKSIAETLALEPFADKWASFGWSVIEVDGHDHSSLRRVMKSDSSKPKVIICHTTKGKGVSFMENEVVWHYRSPSDADLELALTEIRSANLEVDS